MSEWDDYGNFNNTGCLDQVIWLLIAIGLGIVLVSILIALN